MAYRPTRETREKGKAIAKGVFQVNPKVKLQAVLDELEANNLHFSKSAVFGWLKGFREKGVVEPTAFPFEQIIETIVRSFEQAKMVPILTETVSRQENIIAAQKNQIKGLEKDLQEVKDVYQRYKVAVQQGEVPIPPKNKERP